MTVNKAILIPTYIEQEKYQELSLELEQGLKTFDNNESSEIFLLVAQTLISNYLTEENAERVKLFQFSLQKLSPCQLISVWKLVLRHLTSHHLVGIVVDALLARFNEFDRSSEDWRVIMYEGPIVMERELVEEFANSSRPARFLIERVYHVLRFYSRCHEAQHLRFNRILTAIFKRFAPNSIELHELLIVLADHSPFHPYVVSFLDGELLRSVHHPYYIVEKSSEELTDFLNVGSDDRPIINFTAVFASLDLLLKHPNYADQSMQSVEALLYSLLPYMEDFNRQQARVELVRKSNQILKCCTPRSRVLILKRIAEKVVRSRDTFNLTPLLLAWVVDEYKTHLNEPIFKQELGTFIAILEKIRYEDMAFAQAYYSSIITLHQSSVLRKINFGLSQEMKQRVIIPIRDQLGDFIEIQRLKTENPEPDMPAMDNSFTAAVDIIICQIGFSIEKMTEWELSG